MDNQELVLEVQMLKAQVQVLRDMLDEVHAIMESRDREYDGEIEDPPF